MHTLRISYRPDNYPDWIPWREFIEPNFFTLIGVRDAVDAGGVPAAQPGFVPRLSFGKPMTMCDAKQTERNTRRGFEFQVRFHGTGSLTIERFRIHAQKLVERSRATNYGQT